MAAPGTDDQGVLAVKAGELGILRRLVSKSCSFGDLRMSLPEFAQLAIIAPVPLPDNLGFTRPQPAPPTTSAKSKRPYRPDGPEPAGQVAQHNGNC